MWILPGLIFYLIWKQATNSIRARMGSNGGNFMSFGSSGAKIYADSDVKTTFADVAGQNEAKETLTEIVDFLHNPQNTPTSEPLYRKGPCWSALRVPGKP